MISNGCLAPLLRQASVTSSQSIAARKSATTFGAGAAASTANAEEPTPPNVEVTFTKVTDGTGFGTADQCWLNSANGYAGGADGDKPGDNAADDGVVCSGDYVEYEMDLKFRGGVNNSVRLVPSAPEGFPLSYSSDKGSFCRSEGQMSTKGYDGGGCTFRAPDGYTNGVRQTLWYLADNHGGKPLRGQTMAFDLYTGDDADGWAKYSSVELEPVTVISMTYAEASVDTDDGYDLEWGKDAMTLEGTLYISADPIRPKASQTAKGLSNRTIGWSGTLDLSAFPMGTYLKGQGDTAPAPLTASCIWTAPRTAPASASRYPRRRHAATGSTRTASRTPASRATAGSPTRCTWTSTRAPRPTRTAPRRLRSRTTAASSAPGRWVSSATTAVT